MIHNLRAVLDHTVFGLSAYCQGRALTDGEARSVEWPVVSTPKQWDDFVRKHKPEIRFLSNAYKQIIESEQPYRGANEYLRTSHPMHVLHALWNLDKHRQINFFAGSGKVVAVYVPGNLAVPYRTTPPVMNNGSEVVHVSIADVESKEDLHPIIEVDVTLHEGGPPRHPVTGVRQPIAAFLRQMHNSVFGVLDALNDLVERGVR